MRVWWNGIHIRLKIWRLIDWGFKSLHSYQYGYSIMDNTVGFYPTNVGSIPACRTRVWAGSLMVKQSTHNRLSGSSILSQPTKVWDDRKWLRIIKWQILMSVSPPYAPMDKLGKSSLSKGEMLWVRISLGVPSYVGGTSWTGTGLQTHGSRFDSCHLLHNHAKLRGLQISLYFHRWLIYNNCSWIRKRSEKICKIVKNIALLWFNVQV